MKTVGQILKEARITKGLTLAQIEQAIKIREKFIANIEADEYHRLPSLSYAKGFVKNYAEFLGLDANYILAFYRRQIADVPRSTLLPAQNSPELNQSWLRLTPGRFILLLIFSLFIVFLGYFGLQYQKYRRAPTITLEKPSQPYVAAEKKLEIIGKTNPEATITVNGLSTVVRSDGSFFEQVMLSPGMNKILISATSRFGKTTTKTIEVELK